MSFEIEEIVEIHNENINENKEEIKDEDNEENKNTSSY